MSSLLRRYFTFLFVVVSFVGFSLVEDQIIQKEPMLASFRQETQELQDEFVHLADRHRKSHGGGLPGVPADQLPRGQSAGRLC
ncbi:uncharacterized protein LOC108099197 isoform X2 [Drosophila ficusphila]|uniref:uncharacterized protein LOC108099197 isoform X2 n=1 Tax=Drosophila ficusphila TaxID=30025 RepID=UPI0007E73EC7|nr:uncharacterized protein LOC108099197 isoform X2 [Drosophila ficusphila]